MVEPARWDRDCTCQLDGPSPPRERCTRDLLSRQLESQPASQKPNSGHRPAVVLSHPCILALFSKTSPRGWLLAVEVSGLLEDMTSRVQRG